MKTKNLILALVAIVFAVGSAFTTKEDVANNVRVWWKQTSSSSFVCTSVPLECANQAQGLTCVVEITKDGGTVEPVNAFSNFNCTTLLKHTTSVASPGGYDAGVGARPYDVANSN